MFKAILKALKFPIKIGSDQFGNKYYEKINKDGKVCRWVKQKGISNPSEYEAESIPAAWKSWLSKTRNDPPS